MRLFYSSIITLFLSFQSFSQDSLSVLFIGNSYVYTFDLPTVLKNLALSKGDKLAIASKTNGGYTFQNHVNDPVTYTKIHLTDWNYVILQGQSQEPSFPYSQVNATTLPYAIQLADSVYTNAACSQVQYFMTWGRQNGDSQWDSINTFDKMNWRLRDAYLRIAENANASVAAAGPTWKYVRDNHPTIELFSTDGSHPSFAGTYLNACVFYSSLFHKSPEGASYIGSLDQTTAQILQQAAKKIVIDSLSTWRLKHTDSLAKVLISYSSTQTPATYQFASNASLITNYSWNFGDGQASNLPNPTHTYSSSGTYTVQLIGEGPCGSDTSSVQIVVNLANNQELSKKVNVFAIGNNSFKLIGFDKLNELQIFDLAGRSVAFEKLQQTDNEIVFKLKNVGIFFCTISSESGEARIKLPLTVD
ncbi:MAG: PKD domain-containing protein [Flavobacteriales bacterium]|nr:PKD domain-containing protein [Flavobacteriales bacterium]